MTASVMVRIQARATMRTILLFLFAFSFCDLIKAEFNQSCPFPGSPTHGKLSQWEPDFPDASSVTFQCSPGYELLGPQSMTCSNGTWSRGVPLCVRDVARGKEVRQSLPLFTDNTTKALVDGKDSTCTIPSFVWTVKLLEETRISAVKLVLGADVGRGRVTITVGNEPLSNNGSSSGALCAKVDEALMMNTTYYIECNQKLSVGRYISVHIQTEGNTVPLCALEAFTTSGLSPEEGCPKGYNDTIKDTFHGVCYEFHTKDPAPIDEAITRCSRKGGRLLSVADADDTALTYLKWRMGEVFEEDSSSWFDLKPTEAEKLMLTADPKNGTGKGDCLVVNAIDYHFGRSECESHNHVICAYNVVGCGRPRLPKGLDRWEEIDKLSTGRRMRNLKCVEGYFTEKDEALSCDRKGQLRGEIRCVELVCGKPPVVDGGSYSATSNLTVEYKCGGTNSLKGDPRVTCDALTREWSQVPTCQTSFATIAIAFISGVQKFRQFSIPTQASVLAAVAAAVVLAVLGIVHRIRSIRRRKGTKEAFCLETRRDLSTVLDPEVSLR